MKTQLKILIPVLLLILGGCGHHAGYHSTYPDVDLYSINVSRYTPHYSYPDYYDHNVYLHRDHKYYKKQLYRYDKYHNGYAKHHSSSHVSNKYFKHRDHKRKENYAGRHPKDSYFEKSRYHESANRHDKHSKAHVSNKHLKHRDHKRKEYYVSRHSKENYYLYSRNRDNEHSKDFVSRRSGSSNKNRSQKRDDSYTGNLSYRDR